MSYKALYLKYRPQTFEEVAGQKPIVRTLKNAIATGKMAHAYLFAGPRGTGKTSMARLFAKALNCEEGLGCQCNRCQNCIEIIEGTHPDVVEIDAASNNGVDQVRDLIEKVRYAPIKGKYKVYIIDEVHMMTTGAFNALLKTIEEPPENVIFILCTTEPYKVIPTILSRCQRFDFSKVSSEDMTEKLVEILEKEKTSYDNEGLKAIVDLADGGMRDALSILDQTLAYSDNVLRSQDVLAIYGLASTEEKIDLILSIKNGDITKVVKKSEAYLAGGIDIRRLVLELITLLKDLLVYEKTSEVSLMDKLDEDNALLLSQNVSASDCNQMISSLIDAQNNFKNVSDIRSLFELTLLRMASSGNAYEKPATKIASSAEQKIAKQEQAIERPLPKKEEKISEAEQISPKAKEQQEEIKSPLFDFMKENRYAPKAKKDSHAPTWLESEEKKEVQKNIIRRNELDVSKITKYEISNSGDSYELTDDQIFKISVLASKEERGELLGKWPLLKELIVDPEYGQLASLLHDASPFCLCKDAIILAYGHKNLSKTANLKANQEPLSQLLETMLGRKVFVYALDPDRRLAIRNLYYQKMQLGQIPNKKDIVLDLPKD